MEKKSVLRKIILCTMQCVTGFLCTMLPIMGCYPLIPAFFAANSLISDRAIPLYIGLLIGIGYFLPIPMMVKYICALVLISIAIRFYIWANRRCSGLVAGILAGSVVVILNFSGHVFSTSTWSELVLGVSEGLVVCGFTWAISYAINAVMGATMVLEPVIRTSLDAEEKWNEEDHAAEPESQVAAFAAAVDGLSAAFATMSRTREPSAVDHVGQLEQEITGKICMSCDGCAICLHDRQNDFALRMRRMLMAVVEHRPKEEIVLQEYMEGCPRYPNMVEEAVHAFGRMELNTAWYKRLRENRKVIADQLDAMVQLMEEWGRGEKNIDDKSRTFLAKLVCDAKEKGICVEDAHLFEDKNRKRYLRAKVSSKWGGAVPTRSYVQVAQHALGINLRLERNTKAVLTREPMTLTVYEDTCFYTIVGISSKKKDGSAVSGDNFGMFELADGKSYVCLSDGMGSGSSAYAESEMVVDLLQKFLEAGFQKEIAIRMMNSAMVLQGEDHAFSTLDLAELNLYSGEVELTKIGAAASFLKSGEEVEYVLSSSLPTGVEAQLQLENVSRSMKNGDFLVMVSDGVLEYLHVKNPEQKFSEILSEIETENAGAMAQALMERVQLFTGGYAMDDMTILAVGIWEK